MEYRNRSRFKGKDRNFSKEQEEAMQNFFSNLDNWSFEVKMDFHEFLQNNELTIEKLTFHLSNLLDKLVTKLKE